MRRAFDFVELVTYNHTIEIEADSEELLDEIFDSLGGLIDEGDVRENEDLFREIVHLGGTYKFVEDVSPDVDYE